MRQLRSVSGGHSVNRYTTYFQQALQSQLNASVENKDDVSKSDA